MKITPSKLFSYLGIVLLIATTSQCLSHCKQGPTFYDTVDVNLVWEKEPRPVDLAGLDCTAQGLVCHVPSEQATYFLNEDRTCWKFTQKDEALACEEIASLDLNFYRSDCGAFAAGSMQEQALFFAEIYKQGSVLMGISKLESGNWEIQQISNLSALFPNHNVDTDKGFIGTCTLEKDDQQQGCIMLRLEPKTIGYQYELACLLFTASSSSVQVIKLDPACNNGITPVTYLTGMVQVGPGKILVGKGSHVPPDKYDLFLLKDGQQLSSLVKDIQSNVSVPAVGIWNSTTLHTRPTWEILKLVLAGKFPVPIFTIFDGTSRKFYKIDAANKFQSLPMPPDSSSGKQKDLIIPFANEIYSVTTVTTPEGEQETLAYKGELVTVEQNPD